MHVCQIQEVIFARRCCVVPLRDSDKIIGFTVLGGTRKNVPWGDSVQGCNNVQSIKLMFEWNWWNRKKINNNQKKTVWENVLWSLTLSVFYISSFDLVVFCLLRWSFLMPRNRIPKVIAKPSQIFFFPLPENRHRRLSGGQDWGGLLEDENKVSETKMLPVTTKSSRRRKIMCAWTARSGFIR